MTPGKEPLPETTENESSPLVTGFWWGFWGLLLLIITSWFVHVPLLDSGVPSKNGKVSFFREAPPEIPKRGVAGKR